MNPLIYGMRSLFNFQFLRVLRIGKFGNSMSLSQNRVCFHWSILLLCGGSMIPEIRWNPSAFGKLSLSQNATFRVGRKAVQRFSCTNNCSLEGTSSSLSSEFETSEVSLMRTIGRMSAATLIEHLTPVCESESLCLLLIWCSRLFCEITISRNAMMFRDSTPV